MEVDSIEEGQDNREVGVAAALISVHPLDKSVVVAVGSELRVCNLEGECPISLSDDSGGPSHSDAIRAISFGASGRLFASAGDDKLVKIWTTDSWHCVRTVIAEKRVSAVAISHDGQYVTFADKFGVVWLFGMVEDGESQAADNKALPILGHYCSIITSLKFSPDGRFIASADRDYKIRVTAFPKRPLKGPNEIQSFCLGHTDFVSCITFACPLDHPHSFLLSGSGDSTVRLWDFMSGCLLDTCEVGVKAGLIESTGIEKEDYPAVTDICASHDGSLIAAAMQSLHGVLLLTCDFSAKTISVAKVVLLEESYIPTSLGLNSSAEYLWTVMGASKSSGFGAAPLARLRVLSGLCRDSHNPVILGDSDVPGGQELLSKLQGSLDVDNQQAALAATAAAVKASLRNLLVKKQYSVERRELRKSNRNDRKLKTVST